VRPSQGTPHSQTATGWLNGYQSRNMIAALRAVGARPRYTEYADVGHACWDRAYSTPELWHWLRRQCLGEPAHDESASP
jgi:hypothetical protein